MEEGGTATWSRRELLAAGGGAVVGSLLRAAPAGAAGRGGVVGHPAAAKAGEALLAAGGNAVDAIVAAAFVAAVGSPHNCGPGGYGGHAVIGTPDGQVTAIDFNSVAPAASRPDMFPLDAKGAVQGGIHLHGWMASGVPGTLAGLELVLKRFGTKPLAELMQPAIRLAREGFRWNEAEAKLVAAAAPRFATSPASSRLFLPGGAPQKAGDLHRNPELAEMLETLAKRGTVDSFYRGDIAQQIADDFQKHGGLVTSQDLAAYRAREVQPLELSWNGYSIRTAPLTAGGATVLEALYILKVLEWGQPGADPLAERHAAVEALRLAWHDRLIHLGDPVLVGSADWLLTRVNAEQNAVRVRLAVRDRRPIPAETDGRPADGTVNLSAVDSHGMMAALTLTHGGAFGAQVTVDGLGLVLGHGMSRFDPRPGHKNCPAPHKRPLHNMCPTVVLRDGKPVLAVGGAGGRKIVNGVFAFLANAIGRALPLEAALAGPRHHTEGDLNLGLDEKATAADETYFRAMGYTVTRGPVANVSAVAFQPSQ